MIEISGFPDILMNMIWWWGKKKKMKNWKQDLAIDGIS